MSGMNERSYSTKVHIIWENARRIPDDRRYSEYEAASSIIWQCHLTCDLHEWESLEGGGV